MRRTILWIVALLGLSAGPVSPSFGQCPGDCGEDGAVTVDEVITGVNIALGSTDLEQCPIFDTSGDTMVTVDEIITAVNNALNGCVSQPTPTATAGVTPTPTANIVSPQLLGTFSGIGIDAFTGTPRNVRIRIEVISGAIVVTDLNGNLFLNGSTLTVMALSPTTLFFGSTGGGRSETLQLGLQANGDPAGTYANITTTVPPTGVSVALVLMRAQ
jgi:hypothetical protein